MLELANDVIVFEPDPAVLTAALSLFDWRDDLKKITILTLGDDLPEQLKKPAALLVHRPTERADPGSAAKFRAAFDGQGQPLPIRGDPWKIVVVTPIYGGSLPVARHAVRALRKLGHQVIEADMAPLDGYYQQLKHSSLAESRRDEVLSRMIGFTGQYVDFLVESHEPHLVLALAQAPLDRSALARIRSRGVTTAFWFVEDCRLMGYYREIAAEYDYFFHIQDENLTAELNALGCANAHYLPLAADPEVFRPIEAQEIPDRYRAGLSFMGAGYPNRRKIFSQLMEYDLKIWGTEWERAGALEGVLQDNGRRIPTEETALIFNAASINLNLHSSVFAPGVDPGGAFVNPRTFEIAACGAFQLTDHRPLLGRHLVPGEEIAVFRNETELKELIDYYLNHPESRAEMGARARKRILAEHTYLHRLSEMIEFIQPEA